MKKNKNIEELKGMNLEVIKVINHMIGNYVIQISDDNGRFIVNCNNNKMALDYLITILTTVIQLKIMDKEFNELTERLLRTSIDQINGVLNLRKLGAFDEK